MDTRTHFDLVVVTTHDLVSDAQVKFVELANTYLALLKVTGLGEKVGIVSIKVKLTDKPAGP